MKLEIAAFCRGNGLYARVEPSNMFRIDDPDDNRRPDIEIRGLPTNLLGDATVVSPIHSDLTEAQSKILGRSAAQAVIRKNNKYNDAVTTAGFTFVPMAFENLGLWSKEFKSFFHLDHIKPAILKCYWMLRISLIPYLSFGSNGR